MQTRVNYFVKFVFWFSFDDDRRWWLLALRRKLIIAVEFEKRDVECVVYLHSRGKLELI